MSEIVVVLPADIRERRKGTGTRVLVDGIPLKRISRVIVENDLTADPERTPTSRLTIDFLDVMPVVIGDENGPPAAERRGEEAPRDA